MNKDKIKKACSEYTDLRDSVCNVYPINETKGYANRIHISDVPAEDWVVLVVCFCVVTFVAFISAYRCPPALSQFFLIGRTANCLLVGVGMILANIGVSHFVGLSGAGAAYGISAAVYELNAVFVIPMLGWLFAPVYLASNVSTVPGYLRARFGGRRIQVYVSCIAIIMYIFTKISADLYAGKIFLKAALEVNEYISVILVLFVAGLFTIVGGMKTVIWTNVVQFPMIVAGAFYLMAVVVAKVGGIEPLFQKYIESKPDISLSRALGYSNEEIEAIENCSRPQSPGIAFHLTQDAKDMIRPWPGVVFGITILSIWYWCADQVIIQHVLISKNLSHARLGCIATALFKFLPIFTFVLPGMVARVIYPDVAACSDPVLCCCFCESQNGCTNFAYSLFAADNSPPPTNLPTVSEKDLRIVLPPGARGLLATAVTTALISSFTAIFNASSAIFTMDIWSLIRPKASPKELQIVGRVFVAIVCTVSMLWMVIVNSQEYLLTYMQSMTSYFSPPLSAIFLLAVFWKRCNEQGAFYGLMIGLFIGVIRFSLEFSYLPRPNCIESYFEKYDLSPPALRNVHFLYFAIILFGITVLVTICLSLITEPPDKSRINGLTYWTVYEHRILRRPKVKIHHDSSITKDNGNSYIKHWENNLGDSTCGNNNVTANGEDEEQGQQDSAENRDVENSVAPSKWQRFVKWLFRKRQDATDANKRGGIASLRAPLGTLIPTDEGARTENMVTKGGVQLMPISSGLFEEPRMRLACSVALVGLLSMSLFFWTLLW